MLDSTDLPFQMPLEAGEGFGLSPGPHSRGQALRVETCTGHIHSSALCSARKCGESGFSHPPLTQFLQGGDPELVIVVFRQGRSAFAHDVGCDGLCRHLHRIHVTDEGLEPLVGEGRLAPVQLYDPAVKEIIRLQVAA